MALSNVQVMNCQVPFATLCWAKSIVVVQAAIRHEKVQDVQIRGLVLPTGGPGLPDRWKLAQICSPPRPRARLCHVQFSPLTPYYYRMQKQNKQMPADEAATCSFKRRRRGTPLHVRLSLKWHSLVISPSLSLPPDCPLLPSRHCQDCSSSLAEVVNLSTGVSAVVGIYRPPKSY